MLSKSEVKRELILDNAKQVFIRKGFNCVTMKDIIEECNISRGGIYLYFSAVEEIFVEVVKKHNREKLADLKNKIYTSDNFNRLIDDFFTDQKEKLLNMDKSLFVAMLEYCFRHKNLSDKDFYTEQFFNTKDMILELLEFGAKNNEIRSNNINHMADSILFLIEGLRSLAISSDVPEYLLDNQIKVCKNLVFSDLFES